MMRRMIWTLTQKLVSEYARDKWTIDMEILSFRFNDEKNLESKVI